MSSASNTNEAQPLRAVGPSEGPSTRNLDFSLPPSILANDSTQSHPQLLPEPDMYAQKWVQALSTPKPQDDQTPLPAVGPSEGPSTRNAETSLQPSFSANDNIQSHPQSLGQPGMNPPSPDQPLPTIEPQDDQIPNILPEPVVLPLDSILKIMMKTLPADCTVNEDAVEDMARCAQGFIRYLTREANKIVLEDQRTQLHGTHIIEACEADGHARYAEALRLLLKGYRDQKQRARIPTSTLKHRQA